MNRHFRSIIAGALTAAMIVPLTAGPAFPMKAEAYEMLEETGFDKQVYPWKAVDSGGALQTLQRSDGAAHIRVVQPYGSWHCQTELQFRYDGLTFRKDHQYKVSFRVKSLREGMELCSCICDRTGEFHYFELDDLTGDMHNGPHAGGNWGFPVSLTTEYQEFSGIFTPTEDLYNVCWVFNYADDTEGMGGNAAAGDELWFDDMSVEDLTQTDPPYKPDGDVNGDGEFGIADVVTLQKWLMGSSDQSLANEEAADLTGDGKISVFDLVAMKQKLATKLLNYVEPDTMLEHPSSVCVTSPEMKLYQGPGLNYPVVCDLPKTWVKELGFMESNNEWFFTEYEGVSGWLRVFDDEGNYNCFWEPLIEKPVIYLYPEEETDVHVELELTESELSTTYPRYNNGWDVVASPDGSLLNKADGTHHNYLFWDSRNSRTHFDMSKGFCVAGADTEKFLREKLTLMGLTENEMNEFIVYWLPLMEHNAYNLVSFQGDAYTDSARLRITPEPDSVLRVFMTYAPLDEPVEIAPQQLDTFERSGFTVVEWGGSKIG